MTASGPPDQPALWWESAGDPGAAPVVLVHGSMDRSAGLLRLSRRLDGDFHVVRYDRRGYGRSSAAGPPWSVAANVADLAGIVDRTVDDDRRAVLFGHSFGGNVALAFAAQQPERVAAVVVYETPLSWLSWWPGTTAGAAAMAAPDPQDAAEAFMRRLVGDDAWDRLPPAKQRERRAEGAAMVEELGDLRRRAPWDPHDVNVPLLALYGEHCRPHHRRAMEYVADVVPGCRVQMVPEAGHAGPHTHAVAVAREVVAFLSSAWGPGAVAAG
jgi:pimeloyl-ACP methyl ester carboxylesterase